LHLVEGMRSEDARAHDVKPTNKSPELPERQR
jgi:hypothetical protein